MMGEHRSALCHGMQEVERALQEVSIIYGEMVHLQDVYCEIIYQKQDIAVVAFTCIQHALGSGLLCRLKVSLVWEMEAGGWKIRHIHQSLSDDATERENPAIHQNTAKLPVYNQHCDTLTQIFNLRVRGSGKSCYSIQTSNMRFSNLASVTFVLSIRFTAMHLVMMY